MYPDPPSSRRGRELFELASEPKTFLEANGDNNDVMIGEILLRAVKPCALCVTTTVNRDTGERGREPLRTLATYRERDGTVLFGQNLIHEGEGMPRVGDAVKIMENEE